MKSCECTVRIVVGCNSCCIYIAVMFRSRTKATEFSLVLVMFCSTVRNVSLFSTACYWETDYRNFIWLCVSFITHEWPLICIAIFYCLFLSLSVNSSFPFPYSCICCRTFRYRLCNCAEIFGTYVLVNCNVLNYIHKKGTKSKCENYRGITLLRTAYKLFANIIKKRLNVHLEDEIVEEQCGFRKGAQFYRCYIHSATDNWKKNTTYRHFSHL